LKAGGGPRTWEAKRTFVPGPEFYKDLEKAPGKRGERNEEEREVCPGPAFPL